MSRIEKPSKPDPSEGDRFREPLLGGVPPRLFWERLLEAAITSTRAEGALLWEVQTDRDGLSPVAYRGSEPLKAALGGRDTGHISHVLQAVATEDSVVIRTASGEDEPIPQRVVTALPIRAEEGVPYVLELILSASDTGDAWGERFEQLQTRLQQAEEVLRQSRRDEVLDEGEFWNAFEEFSYQLHRSLVLSTVADVAVNDGRVLLGCDRLSLAVYRGRKVSIQAVSGQDQVNRRSEEVRSLRDLAEESIEVGAALDFRGQEGADAPAPHLAEMFARHVEHTGARLILAIPLFAPAERRHDADKDFKSEPIRRIVGCLLIERFHERTLPAGRETRLPMLADHVGASLANALEQQNVYLLPTRRVLGKGLDYFRGRFLAKTLLILGVILVVTISLIVIPWEYRVEAEGRLMPSEQRRIFAPWDGMVVSVLVENGQPVQAGDELIRIENDELHAELVARQNELREKQKLLLSHRAKQQQAARTGDKASEIEFRGQYAETNLEIEGLQLQIEILLAREQSLTVTSPIDGVVATFQVQERLAAGRPVNRGEILLEVMDESSPWRLELQVPEYRMGHLLRAADARGNEPLDVEYVLATDVETTYAGMLTSVGIATRSEVDQETRTVVRMFVETDKSQLPHLRIGAEATGKVACGKRSLGYVLFGDVWEFVLRYVWL